MVSHPCLFVFAVFGLRSVIADVEVNCTPLVISRNAVLDCHIQYKKPFEIEFLKWSKNKSTLALYHNSTYTPKNRTGFRQPWNASSRDISLEINNTAKEDNGEYIYDVVSNLFSETGSVHLEIPDLTTPSPVQHNGSETLTQNGTDPLKQKGTETSRHSQVLFLVGILTAVLVLGIIVLRKKKKIPFLYTTLKTVEPERNLPVESHPQANSTDCSIKEGLLQTKQGTDSYVGEIQTNEA